MYAIETLALRKCYKNITAVNGLELKIGQGELFPLLGVNGAGKTTAIKMLSCLTRPTAGDALVGGYSIVKVPEQVKRLIGVSPQETAVAPNLSVKENAIKEAKEEAGLDIELKRVVALQDRKKHNFPPQASSICKVFVLCKALGGEFEANSETIASGWFGLDNLPELVNFADKLEEACIDTLNDGIMTKDLVGLVSEGYEAHATNSIGFIKAIRERLEAKLA